MHHNDPQPVLPGKTIGILGSSQLGRMLALEARRMGYRVHIFSPERNQPTAAVADRKFSARYDNLAELREFAEGVDVVTFEFENVPVFASECTMDIVPTRPSGKVLHICQNRLRERQFMEKLGLPLAPWLHVTSLDELTEGLGELGTPAILKSSGFSYDGKLQEHIDDPARAMEAYSKLGWADAVLERKIELKQEFCISAARDLAGNIVMLPIAATHARGNALDYCTAPAVLDAEIAEQSRAITRQVLDELNVVGVLGVEFFLTAAGELVVNELTPRPHNSGHYSIDACDTSHFALQLRAVCNLPLVEPQLLAPAAMANLFGELWQHGTPDWRAALALPGVRLHLYGYEEPRRGRKMGHLTAMADTAGEALERMNAALGALGGK